MENNIKDFLTRLDKMQKTIIHNGKEAMKIGSKEQIDFWVVQYKLSEIYIQQSKEMIGQLNIARYSNEMKQTIKDLFDYMSIMSKSLRRFFGVSSLNSMEKLIDKNQIKMEMAKDEASDIIQETTDRFNDMKDNLSSSTAEVQITSEEKEKITAMFANDKTKNNFYDIYN